MKIRSYLTLYTRRISVITFIGYDHNQNKVKASNTMGHGETDLNFIQPKVINENQQFQVNGIVDKTQKLKEHEFHSHN